MLRQSLCIVADRVRRETAAPPRAERGLPSTAVPCLLDRSGRAPSWLAPYGWYGSMHVTLGYAGQRLQIAFPDDDSVSVAAVLRAVEVQRPDAFARWCDARGRIRRSLGVFVNSDHVRYRQGLDTQVSDGDDVYVVPTISGG